MKFTINRKHLLIITASLGALLIVYSLFRYLTGIGLGEKEEKFFMDAVIIAALGLFLYNRKLASAEKRAKEAADRAAEEAERREAEGDPGEDEDRPHWERS